MEAIKRKRVTRVGSGAFSIYLPKKWIDEWSPEQQEGREVDLHRINDALLIVPALIDASAEAELPADTPSVTRWLLSAYVRGRIKATARPADGARFDNDTITAARDLLRHLDERLVAHFSPDEIRFEIDRDLPPPAATGRDLLRVMGAKVQEVIRLAEEAVGTYATEPDRAIHALQLLEATHEEDVSRLFHQALRLVANLELPITTVSDFQMLDLVAADLLRISGHTVQITQTIMADYGLEITDLAYPRQHLLERIEHTGPPGPVSRDILRAYRPAFEDGHAMLERLLEALAAGDVASLAAVEAEAHKSQAALSQRIFRAIAEHWGKEETPDEAQRGYNAYRLATPITNIALGVANTARHAMTLMAAADKEEGA